jgi:cytochrome c nitrite reductase small subunit
MKRNRYILYLGGLAIIALAIAIPPILQVTSSPEFCNSCHVMNDQYDHWRLTGLHREIDCVDCHLPNNNIINHLIWKGIDGTKDVVLFNTGLFDQNDIRASTHAKGVLQQNCMRCHAETTSLMSTNGRQCWSCHRRVSHTYPELSRLEPVK